MNANLKYLGFLAILPLLTVALTIDYFGEADATKAAGVGTNKFGEQNNSALLLKVSFVVTDFVLKLVEKQ